MPNSWIIRPYSAADRQAVREICCETAVMGKSVDTVMPDREIFADCVSRYYTDYEPAALWVAEADDRVVGYVSGCFDSRRYYRVLSWKILPRVVVRGFLRGLLGQPATWRLMRAGLMTLRLGGLRDPKWLESYPAHLHINLREAFRGKGIGQQLIDALTAQLTEAGVCGLHAAVRGDNVAVCRLFERLGFAVLYRQPIVWPEEGVFKPHERVIYGKRLPS